MMVSSQHLASRDGDELLDSDSYRLLAGETVADGIKRVILGRVDNALRELRGEVDHGHAEAVHEARKDLKKIRSALRLVREELGDEVWRRENDHYREAGRLLSGFRDAEILVGTIDALGERFGEAAAERFASLRDQLDTELRAARDDGSLERGMAAAAATIAEGRPRIESWPLSGDRWDLLEPGLRRSYRRGRKRLRAVEEEASVTNLHEWRERVKDLTYQLRLIREAEPRLIGTLADHAHALSDHLGDDHDLALLREQVANRSDAFADTGSRRVAEQLIDQRRGELRFAAISLGERVYGQKPKRFVKDLEERWNAWRAREAVAT